MTASHTRRLTGIALVFVALAAPAAQAGTGPDDRSFSRASPPALSPTSLSPDDRALLRATSSSLTATGVSPDDRALPRGVEPIPVTPMQVVVEPRGGFSWSDAAVGAAGAIGLAALLAGFALAGLRLRRDPASTLRAGARSA